MERASRAGEMVDARGLGAAFWLHASGAFDRDGVAFDGALTPRVTFPVVIEVHVEGTISRHGPDRAHRVGPGAGESRGSRRRRCRRRTGLQQERREAGEEKLGE